MAADMVEADCLHEANTVDEYVANVKDGMLVGKRKTL
jgi:hypothetical protein